MNSLNSFVLEFDVQLTKDKVPVLFHDIEICVREDLNGNPVLCLICPLVLIFIVDIHILYWVLFVLNVIV